VKVERVAEGVYAFISDMYAQVNCGVILTTDGAIVIDTLAFPEETRQVLRFVEEHAGPRGVRYVVNTQSHADHVHGTYLFEGAQVIAHRACRAALEKWGEESLQQAKNELPELEEVRLRLPDLTFEGGLGLDLGGRKVQLLHVPGHTAGSIAAFVEGAKVLFAGDTIMPVPYIVWGDWRQYRESLIRLRGVKADTVVQGHGEVLLRGEMLESIDTSLKYLDTIDRIVEDAVGRGDGPDRLAEVDIESCGKSRIPLHGLVIQLHEDNLRHLYQSRQEREAMPA